MSDKKSYMNYKNVLLENKFINILKNLFSFDKKKKSLSSKEKKALKNPQILKYLIERFTISFLSCAGIFPCTSYGGM